MTERSDYYAYIIFRVTGEPCYVGKGRGGRWKQHVKNARNAHLRNIYAKAGGNLPIVKVREGLTNAQAIETEIALIAAIGRGTLVNRTGGGEGTVGSAHNLGRKHRPETREKISAAKRGRKLSPEHIAKVSAANLGLKRTPETKRRIAAANLGLVKSPEVRVKCGNGNRGQALSSERRAAISVSVVARYADPMERERTRAATLAVVSTASHREKMSAIVSARYADPAEREKISAATKGIVKTPEHLANISAAVSAKWQDPDYRAKHEALWANPENMARLGAAIKAGKSDPALRAHASAVATEIWSDPDRRKQASETNKDYWAANPDLLAKRGAAIRAGRLAGIERRRKAAEEAATT